MRPASPLRLMAVHAHPDDESSKGAATMARYVAERVDVLVVTCTGGEAGSVLNPAMDRPEVWERLPELRRQEMARAREILGVRQIWLGFVDSGFPEGDPPPPLPEGCFARVPIEESAEPLVRAVREFRPQVVTTYDERGGYPHPDHIRCHEVTITAFEAAGDPHRYPESGPPWQPLKLYYHMTFHKARLVALHEAMLARGLESPYADWLSSWQDRPEDRHRVTTRVPCADYFPVRDQALLAHATQVDPHGRWFSVPLDLQQQVWPSEDYQLARSFVEVGSLPEDDLFAGIRWEQFGSTLSLEEPVPIWNQLRQSAQSMQSNLVAKKNDLRSGAFRDACMAMCALVAAADGSVDPQERLRVASLIQSNEVLQIFPADELRQEFDNYCNKLMADFQFGKVAVLQDVAKIKKKPDQARAVVQIGIIIGGADGNFDEHEKKTVRDACFALGLPPAEFDL